METENITRTKWCAIHILKHRKNRVKNGILVTLIFLLKNSKYSHSNHQCIFNFICGKRILLQKRNSAPTMHKQHVFLFSCIFSKFRAA
jgi:hypothetical protein